LLLAAVEQRLGIAARLADCIEDPRAPERVRHGLSELIRYRALLIAAGYPRACPGEGRGQRLRRTQIRPDVQDGGRAAGPERRRSVFATDHQPAGEPSWLDRAQADDGGAMVEVFCDSFEQVPRRIVLDIDDTEDRVHGGQQLALFNAITTAAASSRSTFMKPSPPSRWRSSCAPARRKMGPR
jgi:hypothetical protein